MIHEGLEVEEPIAPVEGFTLNATFMQSTSCLFEGKLVFFTMKIPVRLPTMIKITLDRGSSAKCVRLVVFGAKVRLHGSREVIPASKTWGTLMRLYMNLWKRQEFVFDLDPTKSSNEATISLGPALKEQYSHLELGGNCCITWEQVADGHWKFFAYAGLHRPNLKMIQGEVQVSSSIENLQ